MKCEASDFVSLVALVLFGSMVWVWCAVLAG